MRVVALENGFFGGAPIAAGQEFDVPEGRKAAWYAPVTAAQKPVAKKEVAKKEDPKTLSEIGKAQAKSLTDTLA